MPSDQHLSPPPPLVSVILPTFNRAKTLPRAVNSVLGQTFSDFELIIINDGSTDDTSRVLKDFEDHESVFIYNRPHCGCAQSRNFGLSKARGQFVAFQDSDDQWLPTMLEQTSNCLRQLDQSVAVCYSNMIKVRNNGREILHAAPESISKGELVNKDTLDYQVWKIGIQSTLIRRSAVQAVGGFDNSLSRYIDLELFIRLSQQFDFVHLPQALVRYFASKNSITRDHNAKLSARSYLTKKYGDKLRENRLFVIAQDIHRLRPNRRYPLSLPYLLAVMRLIVLAPPHPFVRAEIKQIWKQLRANGSHWLGDRLAS